MSNWAKSRAAFVVFLTLNSCSGSEDGGARGGGDSSPFAGGASGGNLGVSGGAPGDGGSTVEGSGGTNGPSSGGEVGVGGDAGSGGAPQDASRHVIPDGTITIDGRRLVVDGTPIQLRGVCWNPVPKGGTHPSDLDFSGASALDIPLMKEAGINVVRTYEPITDEEVLDALHEAEIKVLMTVYAYGGNEPATAVQTVSSVKDHPAVLMWMVGNEWNYNGLYVDLSFGDSLARVQETAELVKKEDPTRPVATIYGELPSADTIASLSAIDVWGINSYRGISFGDLFSSWEELTTLPMFIAEYGADAYDAREGGGENLQAQADATAALANEIESHAARQGGVVSGGTIFEWSDEWWKDGAGDTSVHDVGGIAPGGGPYPDSTFNEEWWGIVTIEREPRPAYFELKSLFSSP